MKTQPNPTMPKVLFIANAARWFDRMNGNTYHSVRITRCSDGATIACPFQYGYGDSYRQTALEAMGRAGWLPAKYCGTATHGSPAFDYERENGYPINWNVTDGLKRECVRNGEA